MPRVLEKGHPGIKRSLMIDGISFSIMPSAISATPEPIADYLPMLDGGEREQQRRPHFNGVANHADRYTFTFPYQQLDGADRIAIEEIRVRGGIHRLTLWRMVPVIYTLPAAVQRVYLPRFRKCAAHLYDGMQLGDVPVNPESFPTDATLNGEDLVVTYAEGPALVSPGDGGLVIARQPDDATATRGYTAMLIGDAIEAGDELKVWMAMTFEVSMRAPRIEMRGNTEDHELVFAEI